MDMKRIRLLNTHINNLTLKEIERYLDDRVKDRKPAHLVSLNVDQVIKVENNAEFSKIVDEAELVITDGTPIVWISKLKKTPIVEKIPGPQLAESLIKYSCEKGYKIFLLGAKEGVAAKAASLMEKKYPGLQIVGTYSPPFGFESNPKEIDRMNNMLKDSGADIVIIGLSAPKQEIFVYNNKDKYRIPLSLSLGAAIDFLAGNVKRAPEWVNKCGMEWFYRFILEPKRLFKRYFMDDIKIIKLFFKY